MAVTATVSVLTCLKLFCRSMMQINMDHEEKNPLEMSDITIICDVTRSDSQI